MINVCEYRVQNIFGAEYFSLLTYFHLFSEVCYQLISDCVFAGPVSLIMFQQMKQYLTRRRIPLNILLNISKMTKSVHLKF